MSKEKVKLPSLLSAVLFDMDGVVLDSMKHHEAAWREALFQYGVTVIPEDVYRREGMSGLPSIREIFIEKNIPVPSDQALFDLIKKKDELFNINDISVFEGILASLELLKEKKIVSGLVTGSHLETIASFLPSSVQNFFDVIISSDDVNNGKPHPEPYLSALSKISVSPKNALVVENAPMGILSARAAGIFCIAIETTLSGSYLQKADVILKNHEELFRFFKDLPGLG